MGSKIKTTLIAALAVLALAAAPGSAVAASPAPGWLVNAMAWPTNLSASDSQNGVVVYKVNATGGEYKLEVGNGALEHFGKREITKYIQWNEPAAGLQQKLEELPMVGTGSVTVSGGPGTSEPFYKLSFAGALSGYSVSAFIATNGLTGGAATLEFDYARFVEGYTNDQYRITATNVGSRASEGEVTIIDKLPEGVFAVGANLIAGFEGSNEGTCEPLGAHEVKCAWNEPLPPGGLGELFMTVKVAVESPTSTGPVVNEVKVSGGGAADAVGRLSSAVNAGPASFGIAQFSFGAFGVDGQPDTQAGEHPWAMATTLDLNMIRETGINAFLRPYKPAQEVKSVSVELPLGFLGNPLAAERCAEAHLSSQTAPCPPSSRVGVAEFTHNATWRNEAPLVNLAPERGYPAELGFPCVPCSDEGLSEGIPLYASVVPSPEGYRLRIATPGIARASVDGITALTFGDPGEALGTGGHAAFLTNPVACSSEPLKARVEVISWEGGVETQEATAYPSVTGCNLLTGAAAFSPSIELKPEETHADTPSGYEVDLKVPQAQNVFGQLATPDLKNATVTLPVGLSLSPSAASGPNSLEGCSEAQIDLLGTEMGEGHPGGNGSPYDDGMTHASPGHCPAKSQIGTVEVKTPQLEDPLKGHVYVAEPKCAGNGCEQAAEEGKVFGLYLEMAGSGVIIKQAGTVEVGGYGAHNNLAPGQLRAKFDKNPQFPFEDLKMVFSGGQRSALANPQTCGTATTTSNLEPWSAPESGLNAAPSSEFSVTGCANPMGFAPGFSAGMVQTLAGGFTPFTMTLTRKDGEQYLGGVSLTMPPGVAGMISKVPLCGEAEANAGTCPEASRIGTVNAAAGAGSEPLWLSGRVYLTGPYNGAPFGLSIVVPAVAGPFNLGDVVERAAIGVNPMTAQVTVTAGPLQQSRDGVPFRLKTLNVTIDREGFMFNPTNCSQLHVTGAISGVMPSTGAPGSSVAVSTPFAVTGCAVLKFAPKFAVSTSAKTSKAKGASLTAKLSYPAGSQGTEANLTRVKVDLPIQLPSQLKTLQKACLAKVFEANPASCPPESIVGHAKVITPILPVPLTGPAYLVSHGGEAFPSLTMVLQGYGVTVDLVGTTLIKKGITSTTFKTVPDVPFNSFELTLPQGKYAALAANLPAKAKSSFCGQSLKMPTEFVAQNGAVIHQTTPVSVTGCPPTRAQKLAAALKACNKKHGAKRASCQKAAHRKYGPLKKK
jgi:hypothetical protein